MSDLLLMDSFGWGDGGGFTIVNCVLLVESPMSPLSLSPLRGPWGRQPRMPSGVFTISDGEPVIVKNCIDPEMSNS